MAHEGPDAIQSTNDILIRKLGSGNPLPPFRIGTTHDFHWIPGSYGNLGEQYEGCLVRIRGPLRVARTSGPGVAGNHWLMVSVASPSPDTVLVDGITLSVPAVGTPAVGTVVDSVQGILNQRTGGSPAVNSYRIQLRGGADFYIAAPPNLADAFPVEDHLLRLVFDRDVDVATAQNPANYSLGSGSSVDAAVVLGGGGNVVQLTITSVLADGALETITAQGVGSSMCPSCLSSPRTLGFANGVLTVADLQAPDPAYLPVCEDRSRFAGPGSSPGTRVSVRGVATQTYDGLSYMQDAGPGKRGGISIFGPIMFMVPGRQHLVVGRVQEFEGETELVGTVLIHDEGFAANIPPSIQPVRVVIDVTCDDTQSMITGEDVEGMVVRTTGVRVVPFSTPPQDPLPGGSFLVAQPWDAPTDTILVSSLGHHSFDADPGQVLNVTGVVHFASGSFRLLPRGDADIEILSMPILGFDQLDFDLGSSIHHDSDIGRCNVTYVPGPATAFLNVAARLPGNGSGAWVVRNMFLPDSASAPPVEKLSTRFSLGEIGLASGTPLSSIEYDHMVTRDPIPDLFVPKWIADIVYRKHSPVGHPKIKIGGYESQDPPQVEGADPIQPHPTFDPPAGFEANSWIGCDMPNLDLDNARNPGDSLECVAAACANSLRWLDDKHPEFTLSPNLRELFEQLRELTFPRSGQGVRLVEALRMKLDLIEAYKLPIHVKYQGKGLPDKVSSSTKLTHATRESGSSGDPLSRAWLFSESKKGEDIELGGDFYYDSSGISIKAGMGHMVVVTATGTIAGNPHIGVKDDGVQSHADSPESQGTAETYSPIDSNKVGLPMPGLKSKVKPRSGEPDVDAYFVATEAISESYDAGVGPPPTQATMGGFCNWVKRNVPPGGKLRLAFPQGQRCFNTTLWIYDRSLRPPEWRKVRVWNLNSDTTRIYVNTSSRVQTVGVHDDDHIRNAGAYVPYDLEIDVIAANVGESSTPSNPDEYGGFSLGGRDTLSEEFGSPAGSSFTVDASLGCSLNDVPSRLAAGAQLTLTHPIPAWNPYWSRLELDLSVASVAGAGNLQITCPSTGYSGTIPVAQLGTYEVDLGVMAPASQFSITLALQPGLDFQLDAVGIGSLVEPALAVDDAAPREAGLHTIGGNPSSSSFTARFDLPRPSRVRLAVYDVSGRQIATLASGNLAAGSYTRRWEGLDANGKRVPAGLYFCRLEFDHERRSVRWVLVP